MKSCNAVYRKSVVDIDVSHVYSFVLIDDPNLLVRVFCTYSPVKFLDYGDQLGHYFFKIFKRPLLESLRKDRMVGICACLGYDINRLVH